MTATATEAPPPVASAVATPSGWRRRRFRPGLGTLVVGIALIPLVVATARALTRGWVAVGDIGLILMRAQDVGTSHHPLLGTWTSASIGAGRPLNNPGPLWFDVLAPFVRVAGPSVGLAVGVMAANAAAIVLAAWAARRAGGETAMVIVTALSAGLAWSMGSELLFDPWQPHAMLLPFWALLVVLWSLATGDVVMAPIALGVGSLIVQTHLSFVYVVAIIGAAAVAGAAWSIRRAEPAARTAWRRPLIISGVVAIVAWIQPLLDQLFGEGNLAALLAASRTDGEETIGLGRGARLVASVVALPPWWGRSGFSSTIVASPDPAASDIVGPTAAAFGLLAVAVLLAAVVVIGHRRQSRSTVALGLLAGAAVVAAIASSWISPVNTLGLSPHQLRWLWPISAFVLTAPLITVANWPPITRAARTAAVVAAGALCVLAFPTHAAPEGPTADRGYGPAISDLVDQLDGYRPDGPVLFDPTGLRLFEPYSGPVLAALGRNDVDVAVTDENMVRQIGSGRRSDGTEQRRVFLLEGDEATTTPPGVRRVAYVDGLSDAQAAELAQLREIVIASAGERGVTLNAAGLDAAADGLIGFGRTVLEPGGDAAALESSGWITELVQDGWLDLSGVDAELWQRYAELDVRRSRYTVGVFEGSVP